MEGVGGPRDNGLKKLVQAAPQDFDTLVLPGSLLVEEMPTALPNREIYTDVLHKVHLDGRPMLLHLEFQKNSHTRMAERLLEYNVLASRQYKLPVLSCVIYISRVKVAKAPLISALPDGQEVLRFNFRVIKLWELSVDELLEAGHKGLYPLLPLTRNGKRPEVVETMITDLVASNNYELLAFAYLFSSLTFTDQDDQAWLKRRFAVFYDILEESWAYKEIAEKAREKGLEKGLEEGLEKGLEKGQQNGLIQALLAIVETRFPALLPQANAFVERVHDPSVLHHLIVRLTQAQNAEEARHSLSNGNAAS
ncbi:MAG: Rpn family recombination-promoting nuclease/putative transposase [Ktedonobacteraceae bacterium]|nr:Rpn family recombination-promoting nuclease/putative transposase [Ktedonobacteraceae bacterium]